MALLPSDSAPRRRRDRSGYDAAARQRARMARDLGDEQGQAFAHEPRRRRSRFTVGSAIALAAFAGLGALPVIFNDSDGQLLPATCDRPALEVGTARIRAGNRFAWQAAGPEQGPYVVTIDAAAVTGDASGQVNPDRGRLLAGPTALTGCRTPQTVVVGPDEAGTHEVALFRRGTTGWDRVAVALLEVS